MYVDFGSILIDKSDSQSVIESVKSATNYLISKRLSPIMIGGEHSITRGAIEALVKKYPDLILVQLDAHADLRESYICLLYTSPSPRDRQKSRMPSSA